MARPEDTGEGPGPLIHRLDRTMAELLIEFRYLRRDLDDKDAAATRRVDALERQVSDAVEVLERLQLRVEPMASSFEEAKKERQQFSRTVTAGMAVALFATLITFLTPILFVKLFGG